MRRDQKPDSRTCGEPFFLLVGLLSALPAVRLPAQVSFSISAGARYNTVLVHDQIVTSFDVRPALAPAMSIAAAMPLDSPWTVLATLDLSTSGVSRIDAGGGEAPITRLTTAGLTVGLGRPLKSWLSGSAAVGVLKYFPSERLGLFQSGGPYFPYAQVTLGFAPELAARHGVALELRYDVHKFITDALRIEGFSESRVVHRVALALRWTFRGGATP
jgi:hypothetical protein